MFDDYSEINQAKLDILFEYLGTNYKKTYNEYIWQCPYCAEEGADRHRDNLKYNKLKGLLTCFRDPTHSDKLRKELFSKIYRSGGAKNENCCDNLFQMDKIPVEKRLELIQKFYTYTDSFNKDVVENRGIIQQLETSRGITFDVAYELGIGIKITRPDYYGSYGYMWAFPTFKYSTTEDHIANLIMGYEYRPADFSKSKLEREIGCGTGLAMVNSYSKETEILIALEGYLDCYAFLQYLYSIRQDKYYHIVTPCNGVNSLIQQIEEVDFEKYKQWILFLDNDEAGRKVVASIREKYPFFRDYTLNCGCKDFNEHLLKCISRNKEK